MTELKWHNGVVPQSICSGPCPAGHVKNHQDQCCWSCLRCREDSYVDNDTCITCPPGWAPNENKTECDKLTPQVIDWKSPWALVPLIFAAIGIGCTVFTVCVFIKFNKTPVIMASGRELCYVLLLGILSSYGMTFLILSEPTVRRCAAVRVGLGLCLSLCYSAIFIKTNRISRIFNRGVKTVHRPTYTSPLSQVAICLGIALVNVVGTIVWLIYEEPDVREVYPSPLTAVLSCKVSEISLVLSLMFNMLLILLCTLYAFKTRKIPENYNEAKYIAFTMYSTCIVWLAFLPIYFSTKNDYRIQMSCLCTCLMISASVPLGCLFVPKVYLVLFQPYKNVRQTNGKKVGDAKGGKYSMQHSVTKVQVDQSTTTVSRTSPRFDQQTNDEIDVYVLDPSLELKNLQ
ncbi:metabotropic glutamate receptor 3-like [Bradysia coprophila]|uniref:metabotropic glutamate receptor 3-like n=1 Tax=Bradysia coprophila TaxID=38358 RepID=UPI00187D9E39|nr:metabotropic glutamate receptor 3-like [Bradysia coprophila]